VGILALVVDASINATGGYGTPTARLAIGLAAGLVAGSVAVGVAWEEGRRGIASCLVVALVAGEAWALLQTAERTIAHRDQQQAPRRQRPRGLPARVRRPWPAPAPGGHDRHHAGRRSHGRARRRSRG
ncbi:MAG TPA: hypothetical protein VH913_23955, partial [Hyphomicrobiaceae bacterium]